MVELGRIYEANFNIARRKTLDGHYILKTGLKGYNQSLFGQSGLTIEGLTAEKLEDSSTHVLVVGCGEGNMARDLVQKLHYPANLQITEINAGDPRNPIQKSFDDRNNIQFLDSDLLNSNLKTLSPDLIFSHMTIFHLADPWLAIKKLHRALKIGGGMYLDYKKFQLRSMFIGVDKTEKLILDLKDSGIDIDFTDNHFYIKRNQNLISGNGLQYNISTQGRIKYQ